MQDIQEHERRISVALSRISAAMERLAEPPPAAALYQEAETDSAAEVEIARLQRALDAAMLRNTELEELVTQPSPPAQPEAPQSLADDHAELEAQSAELAARYTELEGISLALDARNTELTERNAALEARNAELLSQIDGQGVEVQRLRMVNIQLREALRGLREALEGGVPDAGQINRALQAELDALRTARQIEGSEIDMLLETLEPMVATAEAARDAGGAVAQHFAGKEGDHA